MEKIDRAYWWKHRVMLLITGAIGCILIPFLMTRSTASIRQSFLVQVVLGALLFSPFTLKTVAGRLWWATYLVTVGSTILAVRLGIHNPISWLCVLIAACGFAMGGCLRWKSDPTRKPDSF